MKLKIDIEKSIEKERLYPQSKFSYYFDYLMYSFFALIFLFIIIMSILNESNLYITPMRIFWISIYIIICSLVFFLLNKMNKLTVLNIKDRTKAKQFIHSLSNDIDWEIKKEDDEIIIFQINPKFCNERQVTFIFKTGYILINVMSFGQDIISPLYYFSDKDALESIIIKLNENKITQ